MWMENSGGPVNSQLCNRLTNRNISSGFQPRWMGWENGDQLCKGLDNGEMMDVVETCYVYTCEFQRSNSVSLGANAYPFDAPTGDTDIPKKRAVILDENGVWRPGEQDDSESTEGKHYLQCSVADRIAGERVSYRLVQQRSLDFGLYNQLNKCSLDKPIDEDESLPSGDSEEQSPVKSTSYPSNQPTSPTRCNPTESDVSGRLIASHSPSEDAVLQLIHSKEVEKQFSLRDVLAHRVPELNEDDDDCPTEQNINTDEGVSKSTTQTETSLS
ncbi:unnamed protein product [Echinostoma caproni]|uniref:ELM2 domain-containing protein n=1 Tax=Echinostoma caproni TaxID=27848 RepID=A0A183A8D4_9TREM|nr:unnamed protein product [Echinostoma caproni]